MIHLHLDVADVGRIRFAFSPTWEAVTSLRALTIAADAGVHGRWLRTVGPRITEVDTHLLTSLVRPRGYLPDFLLPVPATRSPGFDAGLRQIAGTDPGIVAAELAHLARHPIAQQGPGRAARVELLAGLADHPEAALRRILPELERYWKIALAPYWQRIRAVPQADLAFRLEQLAAGGVGQLLGTLHPSVTFDGDTLHIAKYYEGHAELGQRGLILVPCAFAWPDVIVRTADPQPMLTYTPRGLGRLWESQRPAAPAPLAGVIGETRASLLGHLDLPMTTTELAGRLDLSAPTVNGHLKALQAAGIVAARRDGRSVRYTRTPLGDDLLNGKNAS